MAASVQSPSALNQSSRETDPAAGHDNRSNIFLLLMASAAVILGASVLALRWNTPLIGMHSFRQTQTAITSYWILKGSSWLAYETPVMGAPWPIPFEFPIYQLLVAAVVKLTGIALDPAGRLISYFFVVLTIWPVRTLARSCGLLDRDVLIFAVLFLASPIYLYWGTTFLIETMVVFFCFSFLASVERVAQSNIRSAILVGVACGVVAALGKITTFAPFYLLGGLILLHRSVIRIRERQKVLPLVFASAVVMVPPPLLFWSWNRFADAQKLKNPIGKAMVSSTALMHDWNFGTWGQLFSKRMILTLLRASTDTLGIGAILIVAALVLLGCYRRIFDRRLSTLVVAALFGFLSPYCVFTNLHIVHNYYDTANAIFLIAAASLIVGALFSDGHRRSAATMLILSVASQLLWFHLYFWRDLNRRDDYQLAIARSIQSNTSKDSVVAIYGPDWSSVIPYYSQRRAIMESTIAPMSDVLSRTREVLSPEGGHPIEAVVRCPSALDRDPEFSLVFSDSVSALRKSRIGICDVYFTQPIADRKVIQNSNTDSSSISHRELVRVN
jgi:hypothetical protein